MSTPTSLTKENFWNDLYEKHPEPMKEFCEWIDAYKKEIMWNDLFFNSRRHNPIKFHDIPFEMQVGIILRFIKEKYPQMRSQIYWVHPLVPEESYVFIKNWFEKYYYEFKN